MEEQMQNLVRRESGELPYEFMDRQHERRWLLKHFATPEFKATSERNTIARLSEEHINHCSGRVEFGERIEMYIQQGKKAPIIETLMYFYRKDAKGLEFARKLEQTYDDYLGQYGDSIDEIDMIPEEDQFMIIDAAKGKKRKGTCMAGASVRRVPRPKGGAVHSLRSYEDLQEELQRAKEEQAKEREENAAFRAEMRAQLAALAQQLANNQAAASPSP